jgi:PKD repeat protein
MNKIYTLFTLFLIANVSLAQHWCATDEVMEDFHQANPTAKQSLYQENVALASDGYKQAARLKSNHKIVIPCVVHVIHYNGQGNISKAQIENGIKIINDDFNKLNADTSAVRNVFKSLIADVDIEFRLAKKDPNGNCTEGIRRINSYLTFNQRNEVKAVGGGGWDPYEYFNIWIVNSIRNNNNSTTLGYAQFPSPNAGLASTYGIVVRADEWGSIELAVGTDGRTVTHEMGHALNLLHTFQGGCGTSCHNTGDYICDTSPQKDDNNNSCNFNLNTCTNDTSGGITPNPNPFTSNVPDQLENYMGYGLACLGLFTHNQEDRIKASIAQYTKLSRITDTSNLRATGTNDNYVAPACIPIAEVLTFDKFACVGDSVSFTDDSYGGPLTNYTWIFQGGSPSTSSSPNPKIVYNNPGHYDVTLIVSNTAGADTLQLPDYVHISSDTAQYGGYNYVEGFENASRFNTDWTVVSPSGAPEWERFGFTGYNSNSSLWLNNGNNKFATGVDQIISPSIDVSNVLKPSIEMEVAYRKKSGGDSDKLNLLASIDCGKTWISILSASPSFYAFDNNTSSGNFVPANNNQWKTIIIPPFQIPSNVKNSDHVKFMIEFINDGGNNVYIDNFRITGQPVGDKENRLAKLDTELSFFPNPADDILTVQVFNNQVIENNTICIQNILGETVREIYRGSFSAHNYKFQLDTKDISNGVYFVVMENERERTVRKLIIN